MFMLRHLYGLLQCTGGQAGVVIRIARRFPLVHLARAFFRVLSSSTFN